MAFASSSPSAMVEKETDLYEPVATWFSQSGHQVMAEVKTCDVVTLHDDQLTIVELKLKPSLKFIYQLSTRTRYANFVYAALPFDSVSGTNRKTLDPTASKNSASGSCGFVCLILGTPSRKRFEPNHKQLGGQKISASGTALSMKQKPGARH